MKNNIESLLNLELSKDKISSKIFKNEMFLSKNFFPKSIDFRDREFRQLSLYFKDIFNFNGLSLNFFQTVTLIGPIGSGKSTVAKIFGSEIEKFSSTNKFEFKIIYRHLNCRRNNSIFLILFNLLKSLVPNFPNRGFSSLELINMLHIILNNTKSYLVLTLDEIDFLFHDREIDLFFQNLSLESNDRTFFLERRISLIFITRNKDFLLLIDPNNKFGIINNIIKFEKYSNIEIKKILFDKSIYSFKEGVLPLETLEFIVKIADELGDLRMALELLWRTGKNADSLSSNVIEISHAKLSLKSILFVNIAKELTFKESETHLLRCLADNKDIFELNQPINIKKLRSLYYKDNLTNYDPKDFKKQVFNMAVQKMVMFKILEEDSITNTNSKKENESIYYLKISPSIILQTIGV